MHCRRCLTLGFRAIPDILARWADTLIPGVQAQLHIVHPDPVDDANDVVRMVIVTQHTHPLWKAVLISVIWFDSAPWRPEHIAAMVNMEVSANDIAAVAHVHPSPQAFSNQMQVSVRHGGLTVPDGEQDRDALALIQLSFQSVRSQITSSIT